jgi:hypothetical protein
MTSFRAFAAATLLAASFPAVSGETDGGAAAGEPVALEGVIELSKGNLVVGGYFLPRKEVTALLHARDPRSLEGARVRVRGLAGVHVCKPDEQCLVGGRIPLLLRVDAIELLASPDGDTAPAEPAAQKCPGVQCFDVCCKPGEACAHGGGPGLYKCVRVPR